MPHPSHYPKLCNFFYGGEGGIRTHGSLTTTAVFKTAALNHSTTSPAIRIVTHSGEQEQCLLLGNNANFPHIRLERFRNENAAVRLLVIFKNRSDGTPDGKAGPVQCMNKLRL